MSGLELLCEALRGRGSEYLVDIYNVRMVVRWRDRADVEWMAYEEGGRLRVEPSGYLTPEQAVEATLGGPVATRIVTTHGAVGHCNCSRCGGRIDTRDAWCRHCGARLTETTYREAER